MNQPITAQYTTGRALHVLRQDPNTMKFWNTDSVAWEDYNSANWADYAIPLTEYTGSCIYQAAQTITGLAVNTIDYLYERISPVATLPSLAGGDIFIGSGQSQGSNMVAINGFVAAAENLGESSKTVEQGIVQAGSNTTTQIVTDLSGATNNLYTGRVLIFTSGAMKRATGIIKTYDAGTKILTFTAIPTAPTPGDTFLVV